MSGKILIFSCCHTPMGSQLKFVFKHDMELHNDALFIQICMICLIIQFSPKHTRAQLEVEVLTFGPIAASFAKKTQTNFPESINIAGIA